MDEWVTQHTAPPVNLITRHNSLLLQVKGKTVFFLLQSAIHVIQEQGRATDWVVGVPLSGVATLCSKASRQPLGPIQPPIQWEQRTKRLGCKLTTPPSTEVANDGSLPPSPYTSSWHCAQAIK